MNYPSAFQCGKCKELLERVDLMERCNDAEHRLYDNLRSNLGGE